MNSSLSTPHRSGSFTPSEAGTFAESTDGTLRSTINPVFASSPQASRYGPSSNGSPAIQLRGALPSAQGRGHQHGRSRSRSALLSRDTSQGASQEVARDAPRRASRDTSRGEPARHQQQPRTQPGQQRQSFQQQARLGSVYNQAMQVEPRNDGRRPSVSERERVAAVHREEVIARYLAAVDGSPSKPLGREVAPPETPEQLTDPSPKAGTAGSPEEHADAVEASTPNQASRATAWFHRLMFAQAQAQPTRDGNSMASQRLKNYHSAEVAQINQDMQSALQAAEHQIDTLRMRVRSQRAGLAEGGNVMQTSQSMPSIADSDDLQAERDVKQLRKVIERMQQEMAAMEDELSYLREERSVVELEALAQKDEVESMAANLQASEAANIQLTQALQQVERELAQKKAIIRTDGNHKVVADLEDTIELLRGELDELRQGMAASTTPLHGSRPRSLGSGNRDTDLVDMAAELEQAGAAQRELEADMERLRQQSAEQHDALQLVQGELEVEREKSLHLREAMERLEAENKALSDAQLRSGGGSGSLAEGGAVLVRSASRDASLARQLSELTRKNVELGDDLNKALDMAEKKMKENEALQERCWRAEAVASKQTAAAESALAAEKQAVEEQKTRLEQEVQLLSAEVERMAGQVTQAEGLAEEAMNLVEQEGATTTQLKAELAALQASSAEARAELEQLRGGANGAGSSESQAAVAELEAYRQQVAELTEQLAAKEAEMTALRAEVEQKDAALGDLDALSDKLDALEAAEATAQRLRDEHAASTSAAAEATAKLQLVEAELQRLQSQGAGEEASPVASASAEPGDVHLREMQHQLQQTGEKLQAAEAERELQHAEAAHAAVVAQLQTEAEEKLRELQAAHAAEMSRLQAEVDAKLQSADAARSAEFVSRAEAEALLERAQSAHEEEIRELQLKVEAKLQTAEAAHAAELQLRSEVEGELQKARTLHAGEISRLRSELESQLQRSGSDAARAAHAASHPVSATRSGSAYNPTGLDTMDIFFEPSSPAHPVLSPQDLVTAALTSQEIAGLMSHPIMRRPSLDDNDELFRTVSDGSAVLPPDLGLAELRAENQRLRRQVAELEAQLQQPRLEQQSSGSDSKLMAEFARLKSKLAESSKAVSEAASLRADLEVLNVNLASKNAEINQLRGSIKLLEAQVEETQRAVAQCSGKVVGAQQRMFEESEKLDALRQEHAMLKMKYAELQSDYEAAVANRRRQ
ncbi:hypothetical protein WJX72_010153 [[Myrmecia] bisecta]|uniref:Uncharacterized protein n=1 Tax=[Myrmecia] bisecta TaxID=41462 RepID=A0AAW1Q4G1_9CHLO